MHTTTAPRKRSKSIKFTVPAPHQGNFLPIEAQIMLKAQSKRHDKRNTRTKQKRQWQGE